MIRTLGFLAVALTGAVAGYAVARVAEHEPKPDRRMLFAGIKRNAEMFPAGGIVLIGDSLTRFAYVPTLCGRPVLNAGVGGSTVAEWQGIAPALLAVSKPALVVFALGINDAKYSLRADPDAWAKAYRRLVGGARGARIVITGVYPTEPGKALSDTFDVARARELNTRAQAIAAEIGATFIAPPASVAGMTDDGVHLSTAARHAWVGRLEAACGAAPSIG